MAPEVRTVREYCNSLTRYERWLTTEVMVGETGIGGRNPIRIQSMTTTDTMDTAGTVAQTLRMVEAGCELVRITAPSRNEAENLRNIRDELHRNGCRVPLVADIHFTPNAAEIAARIVEKVRINPGNYADKKKFEVIDYTEASYQAELERIRERFLPLVRICKEYGTAMRIGTNHGSLSDRILSRYGDTPLGMVESGMEFLRICREENYHQVVLSMKASNTLVMTQAYRLLAATMRSEGMSYPLHLGVTEAGEAEDGRIKSAVGIGGLLEDGLGDTVRVSLTEAPEYEAPVARKLIHHLSRREEHDSIRPFEENCPVDPFEHHRRESSEVINIGGKNVPRVISDLSMRKEISPASFYPFGYNYSVPLDKWNITDQASDFIYTGALLPDFEIPGTLGIICDFETFEKNPGRDRTYPLVKFSPSFRAPSISIPYFLQVSDSELLEHIETFLDLSNCIIVLESSNTHAPAAMRRAIGELMIRACQLPVVVFRKYDTADAEQFMLNASAETGTLLIDGLTDGLWISNPAVTARIPGETAFGILQAARTRISKTEYISCPSCGRTLFDLQETTARIRARTDHLKGIKIGIMGCIVNGPGEMADADYGYVGTGPGKITLYKEKEVVKKNVPAENAVDELIELIKAHGDWVDKEKL